MDNIVRIFRGVFVGADRSLEARRENMSWLETAYCGFGYLIAKYVTCSSTFVHV